MITETAILGGIRFSSTDAFLSYFSPEICLFHHRKVFKVWKASGSQKVSSIQKESSIQKVSSIQKASSVQKLSTLVRNRMTVILAIILIITTCIVGIFVCPPDQELHKSNTGVSICCEPVTCPAGSQAVFCRDRDPRATCSACSEGSYMPGATNSTQMQSCVPHTICLQSHGWRVRTPGTTTRDAECECLDDLCRTEETCVPCHGSHDNTESTPTEEMTTTGKMPEKHSLSWLALAIGLPVALAVIAGPVIWWYKKRRRPPTSTEQNGGDEMRHLQSRLPGGLPVQVTSDREATGGSENGRVPFINEIFCNDVQC